MKSISIAHDELDSSLCYDAWTIIQKFKFYFQKVSHGDGNELMLSVLEHVLQHYNPDYGELAPYILSLSRTMSKRDVRVTPVDFLEWTLTDEIDRQASVSGNQADLVDEVMTRIDTTEDKVVAVIELALSNMTFFNLMCESMVNMSSTTKYFPDYFRKSCLKLLSRCGGKKFTDICMYIYRKYKSDFNKFMGSDVENAGKAWRELDKGVIQRNTSKRIILVEKGTNIPVKDPDKCEWEIQGILGERRILKVPYIDLMNIMIDFIDSDEINPIKFTIGESYICRTLGGSLSVVNTNLFYQYDNFKLELLTNLVYDLDARILVCGEESVYMLANKDYPQMPERVIRGIPVAFEVVDVTPKDAGAIE